MESVALVSTEHAFSRKKQPPQAAREIDRRRVEIVQRLAPARLFDPIDVIAIRLIEEVRQPRAILPHAPREILQLRLREFVRPSSQSRRRCARAGA